MRKRGAALVLTAAVACNLAGCSGTAATKNETTKSDTAQSETTKEAGAQAEESKSEAAQTPAEGEVVIKYWYPWGEIRRPGICGVLRNLKRTIRA